MTVRVVWYKRDLRVTDHGPLYHAARQGPVAPLYVAEPEYWAQPDAGERRWGFVRETLLELDQTLSKLGQPLWFMHDSMINVLEYLKSRFGVFELYSHQETGVQWCNRRNQIVREWCRRNGVLWREWPVCGVLRRATGAERWQTAWKDFMAQPRYPSPKTLPMVGTSPLKPEVWPETIGADPTPCVLRQAGGRAAAAQELKSFLQARGQNYFRDTHYPATAFDGGSRLSPYLAHGVISLREAVQQSRRALQTYHARRSADWVKSMNEFLSRLYLRSHYMQQMEDEPGMESLNLHKSFNGLREHQFEEAKFDAWKNGETGFPLIDAAMKALIQYGWINYQLRGLLMSFAANQLWLHWREPALYLARLSTDYDPAVHFPLTQQFAGTTGMLEQKIYNPVTESHRLDPAGKFIRAECPALREVSDAYLHAPWKMPHAEQIMSGCVIGQDYPMPIINNEDATLIAGQRLKAHLEERLDPMETARVRAAHLRSIKLD
ncbi:cryptochrome/deoxyribodipyrimidine photo-lyase family protein [Hahella sp. KA22]|uniref:cryptochrome/deoxyribodipyrimidine photo-lyase family protein n=1 Tax=Hahella sp. KA22 TaxID=1628392 RepID=UPI0013E3C156|nr:FAD-binding domain-containing protein [Hahella sp. KA22]